MNKDPLFSIITPTFNRGYIIWKIIQSIQQQSLWDWELLIIDDGSTDNTKQVVAEFQKDTRVKYFYKNHENGSSARNYGLSKSKGKIITYVDSDDALYPNYLEIAYEFFKKNPKKIFATCNYNKRHELYDKESYLIDFADSSSSQKNHVELKDFYNWDVKTCGTGIFHTKEALNMGIQWDNSFVMLDDLDFLLQLGNKFPEGYMHIPYVLFEYLQKYGGDGICSNTPYGEQAEAFEKIFKKHKADPLMKDQKWYPEKVNKYRKLQKAFEKGQALDPKLKYFPKYKK